MNPLAKYLPVVEILFAIGIIGGISYAAHRYIEGEREEARQEIRDDFEKKLEAQKEAARLREKELTKQRDEAIKGGQERENTIRSLAAANSAASNGLLDATRAITGSLSGLSADALRSLSSAYGNVFTECIARRNGLAEEAERLNSEKRTLIESWPKSKDSN